jgi:4-hydroxy-tetrahydrodipicolinate synthase
MASWSFQGTYTALVTPFVAGAQSIDFDALERLVEDQIAGGIAGLVPCGTTGETPTLSEAEQLAVIERVAKVAAGRVPVVAGTGSNSTDKSVKASQAALEAGADGVMIVMPYYNKPALPYYNKPAQQGMREHVVTIAKAVDCPVIVYNIPGRSVVDLSAETTEALCAAADNVVAIKDATGNVLRCQELKRRLGDRLAVMCGDDGLTLPMMAVGAAGVISVSANVLPDKVSAVTELVAQGKLDDARAKHFELLNFHGLMFAEPNPGPCKATAALLGRMQPDVRLPLLPAAAATRERIEAALFELGIKR